MRLKSSVLGLMMVTGFAACNSSNNAQNNSKEPQQVGTKEFSVLDKNTVGVTASDDVISNFFGVQYEKISL